MKRFLLLFAVLSIFVMISCRPSGKVKSPEDYLPFVAMAMEAGGTAALVGKSEAKSQGSFEGCVAAGVIASALKTASDAIVSASVKSPQIPAVSVDVSDCWEMAERPAEGKDISEETKTLIDTWAASVLVTARHFLGKVQATNCKGYQAGMAAIKYVEGVLDPIVEEISSPDGKLNLPAAPIDFSSCKE